MKKLIVIVGPTASGKSSLAIKLAKHLNTQIISGDSVQVYKELNIGSAKVTKEEQDGIKHHLLSCCSIEEKFSVYDFQRLGRNKIDEIDLPIICGGTGFYIQSLLYDYQFDKFDEVNLNNNLTLEESVTKLLELQPDIDIDFSNSRRVESALRLAMSGANRNLKKGSRTLLYDPLIIYLNIDRNNYDEILINRVNKQIELGFIEEVEQINKPLNIIGYRELYKYLNNEYTLKEAIDKIVIKSRQLAKKQKTWFLNQMQVSVLEANSKTLYEDTIKLVESFLNGE